jgi:DNA-binding CsgD family transcriptional regulator
MTELETEIKRLYLLGCQNKSIAKIVGLTLNQTTRIIYKELELQSKNKKLSTREIKEVKRLYESGVKRREIQKIMDIDKNRISHILRKRAA